MRREENRRILIKKYKQRNIRIEQQTINEQSSKGAKDEVVRSCCKIKHDIPTQPTNFDQGNHWKEKKRQTEIKVDTNGGKHLNGVGMTDWGEQTGNRKE
jgi:hypothetical protein